MKKSKILAAIFTLSLGINLQSCSDKNENNESSNDNKEVSKSNESVNFKTVKIGEQEWMQENLKIEKFNNGDLIPQATSNEDWAKAHENKTPAWCYYNNDASSESTYGKLYNWYAVNDSRGIAPKGWRVPNNDDIKKLKLTLGDDVAGQKMKASEGWKEKEGYITDNESGFTGLATGNRMYHGSFLYEGEHTGYWTNAEYNEGNAYYFGLQVNFSTIYGGSANKGTGYCLRLIKD